MRTHGTHAAGRRPDVRKSADVTVDARDARQVSHCSAKRVGVLVLLVRVASVARSQLLEHEQHGQQQPLNAKLASFSKQQPIRYRRSSDACLHRPVAPARTYALSARHKVENVATASEELSSRERNSVGHRLNSVGQRLNLVGHRRNSIEQRRVRTALLLSKQQVLGQRLHGCWCCRWRRFRLCRGCLCMRRRHREQGVQS